MLLAFTWPTHLGGFDFITGAAGPTSKIWENFTLLAIQTWVHLAPPLLQHDGSWKTDGENEILKYSQHYYLQSILVNITFLKFSSKVTILKSVKRKHFRCRFDLQWQAKQLRWLIQIISLPNLETWREIHEKSRCFSQIDNCGSTGWINKLLTPNKKIIVWKKVMLLSAWFVIPQEVMLHYPLWIAVHRKQLLHHNYITIPWCILNNHICY